MAFARSKRLYGPTELPTSVTTLYTVPSGKAALIKSLIVASNGTATTFSLYVNGTGGGKLILNALNSPAAGSSLIILPELHLEDGDTLRGVATVANRVVLTVSGFEYS